MQQYTQRIDVGAMVYLFIWLALDLLRAHIGYGAHSGTGTSIAPGFSVFRYPEIDNLDTVSPSHQDIGGLDVAMNNLVAVHISKSFQKLAKEHLRLLFRNRAAMMRNVLLHIHPVNVLLHQHQLFSIIVDQYHNVGVVKLCQRGSLLEKEITNLLLLGKVRMQHLDGHPLAGHRIDAKEDLAHPSLAKQTLFAILQYVFLFHSIMLWSVQGV